jgi:hypothetical protein
MNEIRRGAKNKKNPEKQRMCHDEKLAYSNPF